MLLMVSASAATSPFAFTVIFCLSSPSATAVTTFTMPHLFGQVGGHDVHVIRQILPCACYSRHLSLAAQSSFGSDFASHACDFRSESVELIHHRIDGVLQ